MGFLPGPVPYLSSPLYPGLQDPWVGGTEAGYNQGQQGGQTDRQHTASAPPRGSMHSQQSRSQHRQRTQASGPTDTPPAPQNLTSSSLSSAAVSRSPVALNSSTRTSEPLRGERVGVARAPWGPPDHHRAPPCVSFPPPSPPYSWGLSWLRAAWRNQRTQAWMLLVV